MLAGANYVFRKLMSPEFGGIADERRDAFTCAVFPKKEEGNMDPQKSMMKRSSAAGRPVSELEDDKSRETRRWKRRRAAAAARIREMAGNEEVVDKETGEYRKIQYRDIVILLRAVSGWSETFSRVLQAAGIPAYSTSKTGTFPRRKLRYGAELSAPV